MSNGVSKADRTAFLEWVRRTYGFAKSEALFLQRKAVAEVGNQFFDTWVSQGKPREATLTMGMPDVVGGDALTGDDGVLPLTSLPDGIDPRLLKAAKDKPVTGFTLEDYLRYYLADIDEQVRLEGEEIKAGADAQGMELAEYGEFLKRITKERAYGTTARDYPLMDAWDDIKMLWIKDVGKEVLPDGTTLANGAYYSPKGFEISPDSVSQSMSNFFKTNAGQMTENQAARLKFDIQEANRDQARWVSEQQQGAKQWELSFQQGERAFEAGQSQFAQTLAQRQSQFAQTQAQRQQELRWQSGEAERQRAADWDIAQLREISELQGPWDWIKKFDVQQQQNPWTPQAGGYDPQQGALIALNEIQQARADLIAQGGDVPSIDKLLKSPEAQLLAHTIAQSAPEGGREWRLGRAIEAAPQILEQQKIAQEAMATGDFPAPPKQFEPTTAPAPAWLPQFVPSQTAGAPITRGQITTPSGQQWARTAPSAQAGLGGFAEWAGGRSLQDIMWQMQMAQTGAPRGAGFKRWQPARQFA